uniref:Uncharacterized protein n=1 Tax=Ditylenchus dipsaci TaxID=166011 RepID=A0A915E8U3_9BILA
MVNATVDHQTDKSEVFETKDIDEMLENEDIKNMEIRIFRMCANEKDASEISSPEPSYDYCFRKVIGYENLGVEILSRKPVILRIVQFVSQFIWTNRRVLSTVQLWEKNSWC